MSIYDDPPLMATQDGAGEPGEITVVNPVSINGSASPVKDLWLTDNRMVMIQAGDREFLLPICIILARSKVFGGYCLLESVSVNGVLCLKLQDQPTHVEAFLRAIYHSGYFESPPSPFELEPLLGILNLSTKYEVVYLRKRALAHLSSQYPTTLDEWRSLSTSSTGSSIKDFSVLSASTNIPKTFSVIKTAYESGAHWILPAAFYECCRYDAKDLVGSICWSSGSNSESNLSPVLKDMLFIGYTKLVSEARRLVFSFLADPTIHDVCSKPNTCPVIMRNAAHQAHVEWDVRNPLGIWEDGDWASYLDGMCVGCLEAARKMHEEACEEVWKRLPEYFNLRPWEQLVSAMAMAMAMSG